jgi:hypothetical protein
MHSPDRVAVGRWTLLAAAALLAGSIGAAAQAQGTPARDPEAGAPAPAPVLVEGETVLWITAGTGQYSPQFRAGRIAGRLEEIVHDRCISDPTVTITEGEGSSELRVGPRLLNEEMLPTGVPKPLTRVTYEPTVMIRRAVPGMLIVAVGSLEAAAKRACSSARSPPLRSIQTSYRAPTASKARSQRR